MADNFCLKCLHYNYLLDSSNHPGGDSRYNYRYNPRGDSGENHGMTSVMRACERDINICKVTKGKRINRR